MNFIVIAILVLGFIALVAALVLFGVSKKFAVEEDPRLGQVGEILPGANCGGCGFAGCSGMAAALVKDSADIFIVGERSTQDQLQLISYPSHRDTFSYHKTRHIKVSGSAEIGNVVKISFYARDSGDSLVNKVIQVNPKNQASAQ